MKIAIIIIGFLFLPQLLWSQSNCVQSLDRAKSLFADGHLYDIPEVLNPCLEKGFTREQRVQAYHLLSMTYLYLDNHEDAEAAYLNLLALEPEFDVQNDNDKVEIVYLNSKFITTPIFTFTARAGLNRSYPVIINDYILAESATESNSEVYEARTGYWFGPGIDLSINDSWRVGTELLYRRTSFFYEEENLEITQFQNWLSLPVSVKYIFKTGPVQSYIYGGVMYDYLISSSGDFLVDNGENINNEVENLSLSDTRSSVSLNLMGGIGAKYRIDYYYIFFELRFIGGLKNIVDIGSRFASGEDDYFYDLNRIVEYNYVDDDYRLNSFGFSVGFENPFYKPRRKSEKRSFINRIFSK
ncbi:MAG: outer membrane beta-barrel protein [Candidatus Cyclobacteriaceae bacterium M2_1C_046]